MEGWASVLSSDRALDNLLKPFPALMHVSLVLALGRKLFDAFANMFGSALDLLFILRLQDRLKLLIKIRIEGRHSIAVAQPLSFDLVVNQLSCLAEGPHATRNVPQAYRPRQEEARIMVVYLERVPKVTSFREGVGGLEVLVGSFKFLG